MNIIFSCIADAKYRLSDLCIEINRNFDKSFNRKKLGEGIKEIFICYVCTDIEELNNKRSKFRKKEEALELYIKLDKYVVSNYGNLDLKLNLGKHALDRLRSAIVPEKFPKIDSRKLLKDFKKAYNEKILLNKMQLVD